MPPNVLHSWDSNASKRQFYGVPVHIDADGDENDHHRPEFNAKLFLPPKQPSKQSTPSDDDDDGRTLWENFLLNDVDTAIGDDDEETYTSKSSKLFASLSSIIIFNDEAREREWLHRFGGRLSNVSSELLEGLR
jgi:hypothetical protein